MKVLTVESPKGGDATVSAWGSDRIPRSLRAWAQTMTEAGGALRSAGPDVWHALRPDGSVSWVLRILERP